MCRQAHIIRRSRHHWAKPTSFAEGKHHSKNAPLSVDKSAFFVGGGRWIRDHFTIPRGARDSTQGLSFGGKLIAYRPCGAAPHPRFRQNKKPSQKAWFCLVGEGGFGPPKAKLTDLQSAPFDRSGIPPYGAGERSRTINLLITNQLLCH